MIRLNLRFGYTGSYGRKLQARKEFRQEKHNRSAAVNVVFAFSIVVVVLAQAALEAAPTDAAGATVAAKSTQNTNGPMIHSSLCCAPLAR